MKSQNNSLLGASYNLPFPPSTHYSHFPCEKPTIEYHRKRISSQQFYPTKRKSYIIVFLKHNRKYIIYNLTWTYPWTGHAQEGRQLSHLAASYTWGSWFPSVYDMVWIASNCFTVAAEHKVLKAKLKLRSYYVCEELLLSNLEEDMRKTDKAHSVCISLWIRKTLHILCSEYVKNLCVIIRTFKSGNVCNQNRSYQHLSWCSAGTRNKVFCLWTFWP